jgi:SH3-like domain-containing protein
LLILHTAIIALLALAGCSSSPARQQAIGEAWVGPMSLNLREELAPRAAVSATVKHGERLEILERRRRFSKVRTADGKQGWTDGGLLLGPAEMARLRRTAEIAKKLPSQGKATPFDLLNVHMTANRQSPSFYQVKEGDAVDVIGYKMAPRIAYTPDRKGDSSVSPNTPMDAWTYIRLPDGRAGWVLSRMLMMSIPDEVAQYAEGHHITSYMALGSVLDASREQTKNHWVWTTIVDRLKPYHFDSFRVFVYSTRRHRYETAYIERNVRGYLPVELSPVPGSEMARFSLVCAGKDGVVARRTYEFQGYRVRMIAKAPWHTPVEDLEGKEAPEPDAGQKPKPLTLSDRLRLKWDEWFR